MSGEDWQVGDMALCVRDDWNLIAWPEGKVYRDPPSPPRKGEIFTVAEVLSFAEDAQPIYLRFDGPRFDMRELWGAVKFRKIHPLSDAERREALADLGEMVVERVL